MAIALLVCLAVLYHIYQRHFIASNDEQAYTFNDLPTENEAPVTADIKQIVEQHLFGELPVTPKKQVVKKAPTPVAPLTPLNIKLTGIILGDTPETGMAMFEVERGRTLVVGVNEEIGKTSATLQQVLPGEALIDRNGALETVKMIRKSLSIASLDQQPAASLPQPYVDEYIEAEREQNSFDQKDAVQQSVEQNEKSVPNNNGMTAEVRVKSPLPRQVLE